MTPRYALPVAVLLGIVIGAVGISALHAQGTPPGYVVGEFDVTDSATYQTYASQVPATVEPFQGSLPRPGREN